MTQVSSLPSSTADANDRYHDKRLPKGIHIVGADDESVSKVGGTPKMKKETIKKKNFLGATFSYNTCLPRNLRIDSKPANLRKENSNQSVSFTEQHIIRKSRTGKAS